MSSCRKFRSLIDLYLDGEADDHQKRTLVSHTEGCKECRERIEEVKNLHAAIKSVPRETLPASFRGELLGRMRTMETRRERHPHLLIAMGWTAAVLLIVGFAWRVTRDPGDIPAVPEIHIVSPWEDAVVEREYVDISVAYDPGEARNIRVILDSKDVTDDTEINEDFLIYASDSLRSGYHMATVWIADGKGAPVAERSWSFYVMPSESG